MADMTLYVRDSRDLRARWASLLFCDLIVKQAQAQGMNTGKTQKYILDLKQSIREYNRRKTDRRIISGDYDGKNNIADEYNDLIITGIRHTPQAIELLTDCDEDYII